ncbi:MAG: dihydrofolate reductase family protein [Lachnospiraceae bacterium]|nr:dihydrofolate reductase family protein [Lachnospiraceae bacterium]
MRNISLFIAMSLDGYIADCNGNVGWLKGHGDDNSNIDTYSDFVKDIDTILMGWNTYHQIVTDLSPDEWVYENFTTFVITHKEQSSSEKIRFVNTNPADLAEKLKMENGKGIWICGGASIVQQLVKKDLIDCYYITVIPTLLGSGIRLFENAENQIELKLIGTQAYNGMVDLIYVRR